MGKLANAAELAAAIRNATRPRIKPEEGLSKSQWRSLERFEAGLAVGGRVELDPLLFRAMMTEIRKGRDAT